MLGKKEPDRSFCLSCVWNKKLKVRVSVSKYKVLGCDLRTNVDLAQIR